MGTRPCEAAPLLAARVFGPGLQPDQVVVLEAGSHGLVVLDPRRAATGWGVPGLCVSSSGRWLARNSGKHVELWECADLVGLLTGRESGAIQPAAVFVMAQAHPDEDWLEAAAALAFDRDSRWLAAATATSIHVWRLVDGERVCTLGPLPLHFDDESDPGAEIPSTALRVDHLALDPSGRLTTLLYDPYGALFPGALATRGRRGP